MSALTEQWVTVRTRFGGRTVEVPAARIVRSIAVNVGSLAAAAAILGLIWGIAAATVGDDLPGPVATMKTFFTLVSDPFYDRGPNDKGIGIQLGASLWRVFRGFAVGTAVAIPLGVLIGSSEVGRRVLDPIVTLQSAPDAAVFVVFITSLWPTVINTAFGVSSVPQSHRNVARVFEFSPGTYLRRVVIPHSLPHILVGIRLSIGIAWVVIVAAEMLSGGTGIGFYVWDAWNALDLQRVISAILLIGIVGLLLDRVVSMIAHRFEYPEVP
jgi:nitrate/nitrite transport system permease protein